MTTYLASRIRTIDQLTPLERRKLAREVERMERFLDDLVGRASEAERALMADHGITRIGAGK